MIRFKFEGPDGLWTYAIREHDRAEESSVWSVKAAHIPFAGQKDVLPDLRTYGIFSGFFEIDGPGTPSTLTLVSAACTVVEDEVNQT